MSFAFRALELHGRHIWQRDSIVRALDVIGRRGLTALVLHETDLVQMVTYPRSYLDPYGLWTSAPTRRGENAIENNRVYLGHVGDLAAQAGVELYVEVKEIGFPDEILELRPELLKDGVVCPSEKFWLEFIERKTDEFFADFPGVAGMISSAGSTEGKASRAQGKCGCALCQQTSLEDWYHGIIGALHGAASRHGRVLAVRDFAYKPADHEPLIRAVDRAPGRRRVLRQSDAARLLPDLSTQPGHRPPSAPALDRIRYDGPVLWLGRVSLPRARRPAAADGARRRSGCDGDQLPHRVGTD